MTAEPPLHDLLLIELRIALFRARSAAAEIEFLGQALKRRSLTEAEVLEALDRDIGWTGFLNAELMTKIRKAYGADVG